MNAPFDRKTMRARARLLGEIMQFAVEADARRGLVDPELLMLFHSQKAIVRFLAAEEQREKALHAAEFPGSEQSTQGQQMPDTEKIISYSVPGVNLFVQRLHTCN